MASAGNSFARASKSRKVKPRPIAPTSKSFSIICRSRLISSSISKIAFSTGPIAATRREAIQSTAPPSTPNPEAPQIVLTHLMEGIGIALDVPGDRMFVTDFAGSLYSADLDGKNERNFLYAQGNLTGIAYAEI